VIKYPCPWHFLKRDRDVPRIFFIAKMGAVGFVRFPLMAQKKPACTTTTHRGMSIRLGDKEAPPALLDGDVLCPCLGITRENVIERIKQGKLQSPEAVLSVSHLGEGKCHGLKCADAFRRVLLDSGLDASQWIDWRFPWSDWVMSHN